MTRKVLFAATVLMLLPMSARPQQHRDQSNDQAVTNAVVAERLNMHERELKALEEYVSINREQNVVMREELSTIRGIGIGFGALLSMFQVVQILIALRKQVNVK